MRAPIRLAIAVFAIGTAIAPSAAAQGTAISVDRSVEPRAQLDGTAPSHHHAVTAPKVLHPEVSAAGWFQPDPLCATPLGCGFLKLPAISPYPKGTFHIGTAVGRQTARAFIAVRLGKLAATAHDGTLAIPLDTATTDGSLNPQAAKVNVCVTYQAVAATEGAFDGAPSVNCLPAAHARYVAKPNPRLIASLKPLAGHLAGVKGFALLPATASPTAAWQVVFKLATGKAHASSLPQVELLVGTPRHVSPPAPVVHHHRRLPASHGVGGSPTGAVGGAAAPEPVLPSPAVSVEKPVPAKPVVASHAERAGRFVTVGYQYPEVWLLPLVLLVLVPFTVRALTKDLSRR